jgi:cyclohexanone monooxygenase
MPYIGGFPIYVRKCNDVMANGFEGFILDGAKDTGAAPRIRWTQRWNIELDLDVMSPAMIAAGRVPVI